MNPESGGAETDLRRRNLRLLAAALLVLSLLQAAILILAGRPRTGIAATVLAAASLAVWLLAQFKRVRIPALLVLAAAIAVNFGAHAIGSSFPVSYRLGQVAVALGYAALLVASASHFLFKLNYARALLVSFTVALAATAGEAAIDMVKPPSVVAGVSWVGGAGQPHPVLGQYNVPGSVAQTFYRDNPRRYFHEAAPNSWILDLHDPMSEAVLLTPPEHPQRMRIQIARGANPDASTIQLREPGLSVRTGTTYQLTFRVRADRSRGMSYGIHMGHPPWKGLGFQKTITIGPDWLEVSNSFELQRSDDNAQLQFGLGGSDASIDIEGVTLRNASAAEPLRPAAGVRYSVEFRFNNLGCRGRDYPVPRRTGGTRILALGDSYTMGVGVHEADTFTARLEKSLNAGSKTAAPYEVINCGVSGYATREERLFFELNGAQYEPNVVLVVMVFNDDMSWLDEVKQGYVEDPGRGGGLLRAARLAGSTVRPHVFDYSASMQNLLQLDEECKQRHARLAVVVFANDPNIPQWDQLLSAVTATAKQAGIPVLDLGPSLRREHTPQELFIHPSDGHPNEIAHEIAAREIEKFLRTNKLIDEDFR